MFKIFVSGGRDKREAKLKIADALANLGYAPYVSGVFAALAAEGVSDAEWWDKVDAEYMLECEAFITAGRADDPHFEVAEEYGMPIFYSIPDVLEFLAEDHPMFASVEAEEDPYDCD